MDGGMRWAHVCVYVCVFFFLLSLLAFGRGLESLGGWFHWGLVGKGGLMKRIDGKNTYGTYNCMCAS